VQELAGCVGDELGGVMHGPQQRQDRLGVVAGVERVNGELQQRRAGHAVAVGPVLVDHPDGEQLVEAAGDELGNEACELVKGRGRAGLVEVHKLVWGEAEDVGELVAVAPAGEEVLDAGERVATFLHPRDQLQPVQVSQPVDAHPSPTFGGGQKSHGLVLADRPRRNPSTGGELVDRELLDLGGGVRCDHISTVPERTVTVNTVTVEDRVSTLSSSLLEVLRRLTGHADLRYDGEPVALTGGFWAELVTFRLAAPPSGWAGALVARVMPDAATAAKETVFQAEVADQGFATPRVLASGGPAAGVEGRAFMVMTLAEGRPLLAGLDGVRALAKLPSLARRLPVTLAKVLAELHRLDPAPIERGLDTAGVAYPRLDTMLESLRSTSTALGRNDLSEAATWLQTHRPADESPVICHGDMHPFNLLVDDRGETTVLDWSAAMLAPGTYDLGFTSLVLASPPLVVPRALRPVVAAAGRALSRRFVRSYERSAGHRVDPNSLAWHQGVVCVRALVEVAGWVAAGTIGGRDGHPWVIAGHAFAARLRDLTGVAVTPPPSR
jgi:aminoglycoside phosphotransferase (APT) family kinase protein